MFKLHFMAAFLESIDLYEIKYFHWPNSKVANLLKCDIVVSSNSSPAIKFTFRQIQLGKA